MNAAAAAAAARTGAAFLRERTRPRDRFCAPTPIAAAHRFYAGRSGAIAGEHGPRA